MKNNVVKYTDAVLLAVQIILSAIIAFSRDEIPTHWNYRGEIDDSGSSFTILLLSLINILLFVLFNWLKKHPELCNFPRPFKNREAAYAAMKALVTSVSIFINVIFLFVTLSVLLGHMYAAVFNIIMILFLIVIVGSIAKVAIS